MFGSTEYFKSESPNLKKTTSESIINASEDEIKELWAHFMFKGTVNGFQCQIFRDKVQLLTLYQGNSLSHLL